MPIFDRASAIVSAVRGALAATAPHAGSDGGDGGSRRGKGAPPLGAIAALIRQFSPSRAPAVVQPDFEAQRLVHGYVEPQVRTYTTWTPALIRSAYRLADSGNLRMAAELCDAILGDDRAPAVLNTRVNAVLGSALSFEAGKGRRKGAVVKALEAGEDWWTIFDEATLGQLLLWGRLLGVAPAQLCWAEHKDHGGRLLPAVEFWHPSHLERNQQRREWTIAVGDTAQRVKIEAGDGKWILFTPYGANRPWSQGLWRGMAPLWLLKQYAIRDWGRHSEVHGQGIKVGIPPNQTTPSHGNPNLRQELASDLADLANDGVVVLPPGFRLDLVEAKADTWEMFRAQIDMANSAMSIMAIGSNLPTEVANAAQTGATAQTMVRNDYKRADAEQLSTMSHDQVLVWWAEFNFVDRGLAPWPAWDVEPKADQKARAELINTVMMALDKAGDANIPVDISKVLEEFEIPERAVNADEARGSGKIFKYHLDYGVLTRNELRRSLGFDPTPDGNAVPTPVAQNLPGRDVGQDALHVGIDQPTAALDVAAQAHNARHPDRQVALSTLAEVWRRGAALAPEESRERWASGRVRAFLGLLATGTREHPDYTADDDLLVVGRDRSAA